MRDVRDHSMGITAREKPKDSGRWRLFLNQGGKTRELKGYSFQTAEKADEVAEKLRARLALGLSIKELSRESPPFNAYALGWLESIRSEGLVKITSWRACYRVAVANHIIPFFKSQPINEIKPADVRAFVAHLREKGLADGTINSIRTRLSTILNRAIEDELVDRNPVKIVTPRSGGRRGRKKKFNTLTLSELHRLLDTIGKHQSDWHAFFTLMAYTGMRLSEARGLRWGAVHFGRDENDPRRFIEVRETVVDKDFADDITKTGQDRRVDLNKTARGVLMGHQVEEITKGKGQDEDYVFCRPKGGPVRRDTARKALVRACSLAGVKRITPIDLRHTYITVMLYELEEDSFYVIEQVGHAGVQMILNHYGHPERYHRPEKVDKMDPTPAAYRPLKESALQSVDKWRHTITPPSA